ncbi:MAG: T9SS type A sorting domain-containing protein [Saprospiraceae bacterium]
MRLILLLSFTIFYFYLNGQTTLCTPDGRRCLDSCSANCTPKDGSNGPYVSTSINVSVPAGQFLVVADPSCGRGSTIDGLDDLLINGTEYSDGGCFENNTSGTLSVSIFLRADRSDECITYQVSSSAGSSCIPLPIELNSFEAGVENDFVNVNWQTSTELNNDYMEVQRSRNGKDFTTVGKVAGAGTTDEPQDYSFIDKNPLPGVSYYRLKQVDYDGAFEIHRTAIVQRKTAQLELQAVPTRTLNELTLYSSEILAVDATYEVVNTNGQVVQRGQASAGTAEVIVNVSQLMQGTYFVRLRTAAATVTTRFLKL